jgi:dethiobiotin synthetase
LYEDKDSFEEISKPFLKDYFGELKFLQEFE